MQQETVAVKTIPTHNAERFSDSLYWTGHTIGLVLLVIGILFVLFARGPRRKDAVVSLVESQMASQAQTKK